MSPRLAQDEAANTTVRIDGDAGRVLLAPRWTVSEASQLTAIDRVESNLRRALPPHSPVMIDGSAVTNLDTAGALVLAELIHRLRSAGHEVRVTGLAPHRASLLGLVESHRHDPLPPPPSRGPVEKLEASGRELGRNAFGFLSFLGHVFVTTVGALLDPRRIRGRLVVRNLQTAGADALPIVGLLSCSAYTAQIGTMRVTEEVDALQVIGLSPVDVLVRPKVFALVIALPLLTAYAGLVGVAGAVLMTAAMTSIGPAFFLEQFPRVIPIESYLVGIGKAPVFALVIAAVGCWQGFQASESAESVGARTTLSVVQSIFLIIVLDAMFSIVFSIVGI
jgi:phospholipid/cholesterol/gamma-HCH transport system permease protein